MNSPVANNKVIQSSTVRSAVQGGTMLAVEGLVNTGLGPREISRRLRKSYYAVTSSQVHLRRLGLIPESLRTRIRQLENSLRSLPDSQDERQTLLDRVSFNFYKGHKALFCTINECSLVAGRGINGRRKQAVPFLIDSGIAIKSLPVDRQGKCQITILFRVDKDAVVELLKKSQVLK